MKDYLFGYGSLIGQKSRDEEGITFDPVPIRLFGYRREWNVKVDNHNGMGIMGLGVIKSRKSYCNGILFGCEDIEDFKRREFKFDYSIEKFDRRDILFLNKKLNLENDNLWYFTPNHHHLPTKKTPIRQSYLDVCMMSCLEINEDFAKDFVKTTHDWLFWINDRKNPCYKNPGIEIDTKKIDRILKEVMKDRFNRI
ncbi:MAG: hypothetical protein WC867_01665 [Candidatus Pacearchaeota archaeon]|jgi:hypothetical protein